MDLYQLILLLSVTSTLLPISFSSPNGKYDACSRKFTCGGIRDIGYPFYDGIFQPDYCGYPGFQLNCSETTPQITISGYAYYVEHIDSDAYNIKVSRRDNWEDSCPDSLVNTTIDYSKFNFPPTDQNITFLYACEQSSGLSSLTLVTSCIHILGGNGKGYYLTRAMVDKHQDLLQKCKSLFLPVLESNAKVIDRDSDSMKDVVFALEAGFELGLIVENEACSRCTGSGGLGGYISDSKKFVCHCAADDYYYECGSNSKGGLMKNNIVITASSAAVTATVLGLLVLFTYCIIKNYKSIPRNKTVEECLKNCASMVLRRYTYANIKKMTKSFKEKLGEGGYGAVFKGTLRDGRAVAVKVWKHSKGDGQEFVNEVMSISRTSHVNVVPLFGFCFEGYKRALVYEFMPNGSLEKFIHGRDFEESNQSLSSQKLLDIAVGIARGLEYLHRGCNTRIVHFDIKPHNILLDVEFTPKISDFGLAKSFNQKQSIISMSGARGTAGYIAPEVFFRTFGGVSHKSDVYSFGMMVLEMVGCTKRVNYNAQNSSELYFPQWIYKQLERGLALDCRRILNEEEKELERKMILVGLWCIQTNPLSRPPISRVAEMLEGKVELKVPPMPSLSSIPRQQEQPAASEEYSSTLTLSSTTPEITDHFHSVQNCQADFSFELASTVV